MMEVQYRLRVNGVTLMGPRDCEESVLSYVNDELSDYSKEFGLSRVAGGDCSVWVKGHPVQHFSSELNAKVWLLGELVYPKIRVSLHKTVTEETELVVSEAKKNKYRIEFYGEAEPGYLKNIQTEDLAGTFGYSETCFIESAMEFSCCKEAALAADILSLKGRAVRVKQV